jgi:hypothetical protein
MTLLLSLADPFFADFALVLGLRGAMLARWCSVEGLQQGNEVGGRVFA